MPKRTSHTGALLRPYSWVKLHKLAQTKQVICSYRLKYGHQLAVRLNVYCVYLPSWRSDIRTPISAVEWLGGRRFHWYKRIVDSWEVDPWLQPLGHNFTFSHCYVAKELGRLCPQMNKCSSSHTKTSLECRDPVDVDVCFNCFGVSSALCQTEISVTYKSDLETTPFSSY